MNTSISKRNVHDLENMANLLKQFKLVLWSAFFLVPTGRAQMADLLSADEVEQTFATLYRFSKELPFKVKTTEAQHYRRYIIQQRLKSKGKSPSLRETMVGKRPFRGFCPSMTARDLYSSHIRVKFVPAAFCRSLRAMCAWTA